MKIRFLIFLTSFLLPVFSASTELTPDEFRAMITNHQKWLSRFFFDVIANECIEHLKQPGSYGVLVNMKNLILLKTGREIVATCSYENIFPVPLIFGFNLYKNIEIAEWMDAKGAKLVCGTLRHKGNEKMHVCCLCSEPTPKKDDQDTTIHVLKNPKVRRKLFPDP